MPLSERLQRSLVIALMCYVVRLPAYESRQVGIQACSKAAFTLSPSDWIMMFLRVYIANGRNVSSLPYLVVYVVSAFSCTYIVSIGF